MNIWRTIPLHIGLYVVVRIKKKIELSYFSGTIFSFSSNLSLPNHN